EAEAAGEVEIEARAGEELLFAQLFPQMGGGINGGLLVHAGQQRDEFVTAITDAGVGGAQGALHHAADFREQAAADKVAMRVVDLLEAVEVKEEQAELVRGILAMLGQLLVEQRVEMARVEQAGAIVGDGELVDALDGAGVLDGDGGVVAEQAQKADGILAQQIELAVEQLNDAEGLVAGAYRHARDGLDVELGMRFGEGTPLFV